MKKIYLVTLILFALVATRANAQMVVMKVQKAKTVEAVTSLNELPEALKPLANEKVLFEGEGLFIYYTVKTTDKGYDITLSRAINTTKKSKKVNYSGVLAGYNQDGAQILPAEGKKSGDLTIKSGEQQPDVHFSFSGAVPAIVKAELLDPKIK